MALLGLDQVKAHLRIEPGDTSENTYLLALASAAERACELRTGRWIDPSDAPDDSLTEPFSATDLDLLRQAALIMIGEWYCNREASAEATGIAELPLAVTWILDPLRDFADR
ncbi:MAG: head-tail connector protein [Burkholderiaceae bacterium]